MKPCVGWQKAIVRSTVPSAAVTCPAVRPRFELRTSERAGPADGASTASTSERCSGSVWSGREKTRIRATDPGRVQPSSSRPDESQSARHGSPASISSVSRLRVTTAPEIRKRLSPSAWSTNRVGEAFATPVSGSKRSVRAGKVLGVPTNWPG